MLTYGFYNSQNHDRRYNAEQFSRMFNMLINDGVFASYGSRFMIRNTVPTTMSVIVGSGFAWFKSTWSLNDVDMAVPIEASNAVYSRIDTVVLEVHSASSYRQNAIKVIKGTPASNPVAPSLTNSAASGIFQFPLADVYVRAQAVGITQSNITNRIGTTSTPWVTGILQTVDLTSMYAKWEEDFTKWLNGTKSEWGTLRETINSDIRDFIENGQVEIDDVIAAANQSIRNYETEFQTFLATSGGTFDTQMDAWDAAFQEWFKNVQTSLEGDIGATLTLKVADLERRMTEAEGKIQTQQTEVSGLKTNVQLLQSNLTTGLAGKLDKSAIATQTQAEAGTLNSGYMTPLRTKEAIMALSPPQDVSKVGDIRFTKFPEEMDTWSGEWVPMMGQYLSTPSYSNPGGSYVSSPIAEQLRKVSHYEASVPLNATDLSLRVDKLTDYIGPVSESNWLYGLFGCICDYTLRVNFAEPPILMITMNSRSSIIFLNAPSTSTADGYQIVQGSKNLGTSGFILGQILVYNKPVILYMDRSINGTNIKVYFTFFSGGATVATNSVTFINNVGEFSAYNSNCVIATSYPSDNNMTYTKDGPCTTIVLAIKGALYRVCVGFSDDSRTSLTLHNPLVSNLPLPDVDAISPSYPKVYGLEGYLMYSTDSSSTIHYLDVRTWRKVSKPYEHNPFESQGEVRQKGGGLVCVTDKNTAFTVVSPSDVTVNTAFFASAETKSASLRYVTDPPLALYSYNKCIFPMNPKAFAIAAGLYIPKNGFGKKMDSGTYWLYEINQVRHHPTGKGDTQYHRYAPHVEAFGGATASATRFRVFSGHHYQTIREDMINDVLVGGLDSTSTGANTAIIPTHLYVRRVNGPNSILWRVPIENDGYLKIND